eukprot:8200119-Alexandrium_andersonii.AAC.1
MGHVVALAVVRPGTLYESPLTLWDSEERTLWNLLGCPSDAYSVRVLESVCLEKPVQACWPDAVWTGSRSCSHLAPSCVRAALSGPVRLHSGELLPSAVRALERWFPDRPASSWDANGFIGVAVPCSIAIPLSRGFWHRL